MKPENRLLDRIDHEILAALQNNARQSNKELAASIGLAPSSCLERVKRLVHDGIIRGFHADVDPKALGITLEALVFVRIVRHQRELMEALWAHLAAQPEVRDLYDVAGSHDLVVHVAVRDVEHLRRLVAEQIAGRAELGQLETSLIFQHRRSNQLPDYGHEHAAPARGRHG
ncbi:Lrp/AsnC family transcriptional regulator [Enhygromyxa salina]|uniref:Leucine-responsive regulatory protein n=1 Tax=Enhygromyxa salina TaxID=215803 RepID=A0A2S9YPK9_9BACT|nr:Lrp/AsnC family transcriptional regulator [Enhygromyxa salina]PRQ07031.1 Leucine-responsive regulatory protein [Enhygromyxa salina]